MNDAMTLASMITQQQHTRQTASPLRQRGGDFCYKQRRNFDAGVVFFFLFCFSTNAVRRRDLDSVIASDV